MAPENFQYSIQERVFLKRISLFFDHAVGNIVSAIIGAFLISVILYDTNAALLEISLWFLATFLLACIVLYIGHAFKSATLTMENSTRWLSARLISGASVGVMYGIAPFLFSEHLSIHHEMFIFIVLSAMISVSSTGYSVMPYYYVTLNCVTMLPLTLYFLLNPTSFHIVLAITSSIWQFVVLSKSLRVSNSSINEIYLNESLLDEVNRHQKTKQKLEHLATHDALTGLPNRRLLEDRVDNIIKLANRMNKQAVIMFVDLDGFKVINDIHGHECGDVLLTEIANRLMETIRESDTIARIGGDEFILAYTEMEGASNEVEILAQRIIKSLRKPITLPDGGIESISASIGIALFPDNGKQVKELIKAADDAMYKVKYRGKNNYGFA